ncbi:MAG: hypothetical protein IKE70_03995 [Bacilli bacterium]|nr:hypothetical protein [Bacilli bacterium]
MAGHEVKLSPEAVLNMANELKSHLNEILTQNKNTAEVINTIATGNNGDSFWDGARSFAWLSTATRTCCNVYYRVYVLAQFFKHLCSNAADLDFADNDKKYDTGKKLLAVSNEYDAIMSTCTSGFNTVLGNAQK